MHAEKDKYLNLKGKYTLFGEGFYLISRKLGDPEVREVARHAGVDASTLFTNTQNGKQPGRDTVTLVVQAFKRIAVIREIPWDYEWDVLLYHAANYSTPQEHEETRARLKKLAAEQKASEERDGLK